MRKVANYVLVEVLEAALVTSVELLRSDIPAPRKVEVLSATMVLIERGIECELIQSAPNE